MSVDRVPVRQGLFVDDEPPRLVVGRCSRCQRLHFPQADTCPYCSFDQVSTEECSGQGRLWAATAVTAAPPGYRGPVPYGFGVVELEEGLRVVTQLTEPDPAALSLGQPVSLRVIALHREEAAAHEGPAPPGPGTTVVTYAFGPREQR